MSYWSSLLLHNCINTVYINGQLGLIDSKLVFNEEWQKIIDEKSPDEKTFSFSQKILPKTTSVQRFRYWIPVAAEMEPDVHL